MTKDFAENYLPTTSTFSGDMVNYNPENNLKMIPKKAVTGNF